jgi:tetratricopeptide (TPR) repeat protein
MVKTGDTALETTGDTDQLSHESLRIEADDAYRNDNYSAAIRLYSSALERLERTAPKDRERRIRILTWLALSYQMEKDFTTARHFHEEELRVARLLRDRGKIADALHRLGDAYIELKDDRRAERCLSECLKMFRGFGPDRREIPHLIFDLAEIAERREEHRNASALFREWIRVQKERRADDLSMGWFRLGVVTAKQKEWESAEDYFYTALVAAQDAGNGYWEACALYGLGRVADDRGKYARAEHLAKEALDLASSLRDLPLIARIQILSGNVAFGAEKFEAAGQFYRAYVGTVHATSNWPSIVTGLQNLAAAYFRRNLFGFSALAFGLLDAVKEHAGADVPSQFADYYRARCRKSVSEETWEKAHEKARTMSIPDALAYFSGE